jgi:uncharacterized protein (TIGR02246 family)
VSDESTTEIRELYDRLLAAWNGRDAEKFAAFFGTDGVSIGFDGSTATGPEIRDHLAGVFDDHSTASYVAKVREVRQLGADTVLLRAIVGMLPPGADRLKPDVNALQTVVAVRDGDSWRVALLQNTPAQYHGRPELVEQHTEELQELVRT